MTTITTLQRSARLRHRALTVALMGGLMGLAGGAMAQSGTDPSYEAAQQPATRASVYADLVRLEQAGWNPEIDRDTYPTYTSAAELRANPPTGPQYAVADTSQGPTNPMPAN